MVVGPEQQPTRRRIPVLTQRGCQLCSSRGAPGLHAVYIPPYPDSTGYPPTHSPTASHRCRDTSGRDRHREFLAAPLLSKAAVVVLVYDVTAPASLEDAAAWGQEVAKHCREAPQPGEWGPSPEAACDVGCDTCQRHAARHVRVDASMWQL